MKTPVTPSSQSLIYTHTRKRTRTPIVYRNALILKVPTALNSQ